MSGFSHNPDSRSAGKPTRSRERSSGPASQRSRVGEQAATQGNQQQLRSLQSKAQRILSGLSRLESARVRSNGAAASSAEEREAERVSEQVTGLPEAPQQARANALHPPGERADLAALSQAAVPPAVRNALHGPGQPLDADTREDMERRFGVDFSQVRVRTDEQAAASARAIDARAYTLGPNIAFAAGQYAPGTRDGKRLLAHELTHVVQQSRTPCPELGISQVDTPSIQRRLVATGDRTGFANVANMIMTVRNQLAVSAAGVCTLTPIAVQGPPTREEIQLAAALNTIISDSTTTTVAFIHGTTSTDATDRQVMIGSYAAARIDLDDINMLGLGEGISSGSALAHELIEQYRRQVFAEDYPTAHAAGMAAEAAMTGATRGASTRTDIDANSYEIEVAYHYPDRTVFVTRVVRDQNIVAVRRRTTRP